MTLYYAPIVHNWHQYLDKGNLFLDSDVTDKTDTVEILYFDSDVDEIMLIEWYEEEIEALEPPDDWIGMEGDFELDDFSFTEVEKELPMEWSEAAQKIILRRTDE